MNATAQDDTEPLLRHGQKARLHHKAEEAVETWVVVVEVRSPTQGREAWKRGFFPGRGQSSARRRGGGARCGFDAAGRGGRGGRGRGGRGAKNAVS
jgi:hypothetical protein